MKRKIHMELLIIAALAIVLTLLFALFVFYGLFQEQIIGDLREDAIAFRSMNVFADPEDLDIGSYQMASSSLPGRWRRGASGSRWWTLRAT